MVLFWHKNYYDKRINERKFGIDYLGELPKDFTKNSFENKDLKNKDGESLNELDARFKSFINDLLNNDSNKIAIVMHGIILLSYLKTICDTFTFDGKTFDIRYEDNIILNGTHKNPSVYKIEFDDSKNVSKNLDLCQVFRHIFSNNLIYRI